MDYSTADSIQYYNFNGSLEGILVVSGNIRMTIPLDPNNADYAEIMRQVDEGTLTIQDADD